MHSFTNFRKQNSKTRKAKIGGSPKKINAASIKAAAKKLNSLIENPTPFCTSGNLSSSLPPAILEAKKAIEYANSNPGNEYAEENAEIKSKIADFWTEKCSKRKNWRNEKNMTPNHGARDWYEPVSHVVWKIDINAKAREKMNTILPDLKEHVSLIPEDNEHSEIGKEYRKSKKRFERRARGSRSKSRSRSSSRSSSA